MTWVSEMSDDNMMTPILWRELSTSEEKKFRAAARACYTPGTKVDLLWHPVYLHECYRMNKEAGILKKK